MKRFIKKLMFYVFLVTGSVLLLSYLIVAVVPPQFEDLPTSVMNRKYNRLLNTASPKIIIVAGSSGGFGIDRELLEKETGMPVCNMALAAGLGMPFSTNITKANIGLGDIVVLAYEYVHWESFDESMQPELLAATLDSNPCLLRYVEKESYQDILRYFPTYALKKMNAFFVTPVEGGGVNDADAYDINGDLKWGRPACILPELVDQKITVRSESIDPVFSEFVNNYIAYARSLGAEVVISFPPALDEAVSTTEEEIASFEDALRQNINCPIISNAEDYIYTREWMYDTVYHCNEAGMERRTLQLADDLAEYLKNKKESDWQ